MVYADYIRRPRTILGLAVVCLALAPAPVQGLSGYSGLLLMAAGVLLLAIAGMGFADRRRRR